MGGPIKSPWEITTRAVPGVPGPNDLLLYAPQPGVPFTTECKSTSVGALLPVISACGFPGTTAGDKIQAAIAALPPEGGTVDARCFEGAQVIPNGATIFAAVSYTKRVTLWLGDAIFSVTNPIVLGPALAFTMMGTATAGGPATAFFQRGTTFKWDGTNGATVLAMNRCRECLLQGFSIVQGTGTIGIGIRVDHITPPVGAELSSANCFTFVHFRSFGTGLQVGNTSVANNDEHRLNYCSFVVGTTGVFINDAQSKFISMDNCFFDALGIAVHGNQGSFSAVRCHFNGSSVSDFQIDDPRDANLILYCQTENSVHFFTSPNATSATMPVTIQCCRTGHNAAVSPFISFHPAGIMYLLNNQFADGVHDGALMMNFGVNNLRDGTTIVSMGNVYWREDIWNVSVDPTQADIVSYGDIGLDALNLPVAITRLPGTHQGRMTLVNGANNDIIPDWSNHSGFYSIVGPTLPFNISGFAGGVHGQEMFIFNSTAQQMTIIDAAGSVAANQILTLAGAPVVLRVGTSAAAFVYDSVLQKWLLRNFN